MLVRIGMFKSWYTPNYALYLLPKHVNPKISSNQVKAMHKFCDYRFLIDPITDEALKIGIMSLIKTKTLLKKHWGFTLDIESW
jgi:hypothetical protein